MTAAVFNNSEDTQLAIKGTEAGLTALFNFFANQENGFISCPNLQIYKKMTTPIWQELTNGVKNQNILLPLTLILLHLNQGDNFIKIKNLNFIKIT